MCVRTRTDHGELRLYLIALVLPLHLHQTLHLLRQRTALAVASADVALAIAAAAAATTAAAAPGCLGRRSWPGAGFSWPPATAAFLWPPFCVWMPIRPHNAAFSVAVSVPREHSSSATLTETERNF